MAVIGNAPFQGLVSGGEILDASIEGVDLSTSAIAARLGYTPVNPAAAAITGGTINGTTIGATTAATGAFTNLVASGTLGVTGVATLASGAVLNTPASVTLTNATGLPVATGVSGLGTGVATALAANVGSAGAPVVNGGVLGTPSSGTVTNLTGTASININGTVGATTANTGAFTTLAASGAVTLSGGTANGVPYLNGSKVVTSGSTLTYNGSVLSASGNGYTDSIGSGNIQSADGTRTLGITSNFTAGVAGLYSLGNNPIGFYINSAQQMRLSSAGAEITGTLSAGNTTLTGTTALTVNRSGAQGQITLQNNGTSTGILIAGASNGLVFYDAVAGLQMGTWASAAGLAVEGSLSASASSGAGGIAVGSAAGRAQYQYVNFGGAVGGTDYGWQIGRSPSGGVGPADGFYIYDLKGNATRLSINGSGNVGVGTADPQEKLHVQGKMRLFDGGYPYIDIGVTTSNYFRILHDNPNDRLQIGKNNATAMVVDGSNFVHFYAQGIASAGTINLTSADPFIRFTASGGTANKMKWDIRAIGSTGSEALEFRTINDANTVFSTKLCLAHGGNVGIGNTNPAYKLHVSGTVGVNSGYTSGNFGLFVQGLGAGVADARAAHFRGFGGQTTIGGTGPTIVLQNADGTNGNITKLSFETASNGEAVSINCINTDHGNFYGDMAFNTRGSAGYSEKLRITANGNVGIGTDNPAYKLHVNGATYINGTFIQSALTSYQQQVITLSLNSTGWVKLFTMDSPGGCRVRYRAGSQNSEEIGEFTVKATYVVSSTQLTWSRQTYYHNINEIRVTGSNAGPYTVWALVRTTDFAPNFWWQLLEANSYITLHNVVDTPAGSTISLSYPGYSSTNFNHDVAVTGKLNVKGTAGNADPFIRFEAVSPNNTFNWVSQAMASNLAGGNNLVHFIGQDPSTKNSGYIGYKHSSSSSDNNILTFGLYGVDNVLNINGAGKVGVNTQQPLHTLDVNGALGVNELYGRTSRDTGGGNIDLTEYNANNFVILEVFGSINPNSGGSGYVDPIHMYVYVGRGWNGSDLTSYIYVQHVAPQARDIYPSGGGMGNAIDAVWFNGTTESDTVTAGTTSSYVRLKAYNYNATYGSGFSVRVIRRA